MAMLILSVIMPSKGPKILLKKFQVARTYFVSDAMKRWSASQDVGVEEGRPEREVDRLDDALAGIHRRHRVR